MRGLSRARVDAAVGQGRTSGNGWVRARCPFCVERTGKEDKRGAFSFNTITGWCTCFKCGLKARVEGFEDAPIFAEVEPQDFGPNANKAPEGFVELWRGEGLESNTMKPARDYLLSRKVPQRIWKEAHIGACWEGKYAGRVVFPVIEGSRWVGFVTRLHRKAKPDESTYLYPPWMQRATTLYNRKVLEIETEVPVIVVEGVLDALALWPHAVAVLGKPSKDQTLMLVNAKRPISVIMDGDAWEEGYQLALKLKLEGQRAGFVRLPPRIDPDEVDRDELFDAAVESIF